MRPFDSWDFSVVCKFYIFPKTGIFKEFKYSANGSAHRFTCFYLADALSQIWASEFLFHLEIDWIHSSYAFAVLVFSFLWKNTGYYVILWIAGLQGIPDSLYEAASIDGAGAWGKFRYITLPCLTSVASMAVVLAVTGCFKSYREAYLLAGEYPDKSIYMIQQLFHNWFREMSLEKMAACAVILVLLFTILVYPFRKRDGGKFEDIY